MKNVASFNNIVLNRFKERPESDEIGRLWFFFKMIIFWDRSDSIVFRTIGFGVKFYTRLCSYPKFPECWLRSFFIWAPQLVIKKMTSLICQTWKALFSKFANTIRHIVISVSLISFSIFFLSSAIFPGASYRQNSWDNSIEKCPQGLKCELVSYVAAHLEIHSPENSTTCDRTLSYWKNCAMLILMQKCSKVLNNIVIYLCSNCCL